MLCFDSLK